MLVAMEIIASTHAESYTRHDKLEAMEIIPSSHTESQIRHGK